MHESDSRIRVNCRLVVMIAMCFVAVVMLCLMYQEQEKVSQCTHKMETQQLRQENRPIQVIIQNPFINETSQRHKKNTSTYDRPPAEPVKKLHEPVKWDYNWDKMQWKNPNDSINVPARTIVLVRHGQYVFQTGLLNDKGKKQANLTGQRLKHIGMKFNRLIHSPLARAKQTADIIKQYLPNVPVETDVMLEEGGPAHPDPTISYWGLPDRAYHVDGPRLESAFRKYFHRAEKSQKEQSYDLLIGHANIFRYFILRALQLNKSAWMRIFISHASITLLHINSDSTVSMTRCGDSGHFPNNLVSF